MIFTQLKLSKQQVELFVTFYVIIDLSRSSFHIIKYTGMQVLHNRQDLNSPYLKLWPTTGPTTNPSHTKF